MLVEGQEIATGGAFLYQRTRNTQLTVACGLRDLLPGYPHAESTPVNEDGQRIGNRYTVPINAGQPVVFEKYIAYCTSLDTRPDDLHDTVRDEIDQAGAVGFEALCAEQRAYLDRFWQNADITIRGRPAPARRDPVQYVPPAAIGGAERDTSIPAKGLTGQGYNGHYFWDTEAYMLPFFLHTHAGNRAETARYRFHTLKRRPPPRPRDVASHRRALSRGAPSTGRNVPPTRPTGTAQYHINADIAFAVKRYFEATGDVEFMRDYGAEILFETARLWADLGAYIPMRGGRFCIHGVTGPDEYTTLVDNNTYTNLMARENLAFAAQIAAWMQDEYPDHFRRLSATIGLNDDEPGAWQRAADQMVVPEPVNVGTADDPRLIMPQDDSFLFKPVWPLADNHDTDEPLLLRHHPLVYNRYQVCKQADLILAEFMLGHLPVFRGSKSGAILSITRR